MSELFLSLFNSSITAIWLILTVVALRLVLKKAPKSIHCLLWAVVGARLALPFSIQSVFSLIPSAQVIRPEYLDRNTLQVSTGLYYVNSHVNDYLDSHYYEGVTVPTGFLDYLARYSGVIWISGMAAMMLWAFFSWHKLRRRVAEAIPEGDGLYRCDSIGSPFVLGLFRPKIYLPAAISPEDTGHVIAHEKAHIHRRDHWWKPLGFLLLTIHWFNPAVWVAYVLLCRDIELACDERVIQELGESGKADYSRALLRCAARNRSIAVCPSAFGEFGIKQRVRNVLHYKRPAFWMLAASILLCAVVAVCFLTDPPEEPPAPVSDFTQVSETQDRVTVANPLSSAWPRVYTDSVVVNRIYDMFQNLTWQEATAADKENRNLRTWLSVELVYNGQRRSLFIDESGVGNLYNADGSAYDDLPTLKFDRGTYDFDYLWLLYTGSHEASDVHPDSYTGGALLCQSMALSFLPTDGSDYTEVTESGKILTIRGKDGDVMFLGSRAREISQTRKQTISAYDSAPQYGSGLEGLLPDNTETVTIRIYENEEDRQFSIWQLDFEDDESWLWLAEGGEDPLRIFELINVDESFHPGVECYLWTHSLSTPTLPVRFEGDFTSVDVSVSTGTISTAPPPPVGFRKPVSTLSGLTSAEPMYWLLPDADILRDDPVLTYTFTLEDGSTYQDSIKLRRLSQAKSLFGNVTYGVSQDWLGAFSSRIHMAKLSADEDFTGLTVTLDGLLHSSTFQTTIDPIPGMDFPTEAEKPAE